MVFEKSLKKKGIPYIIFEAGIRDKEKLSRNYIVQPDAVEGSIHLVTASTIESVSVRRAYADNVMLNLNALCPLRGMKTEWLFVARLLF